MPEYLHPGVYIEEIERGPRPIEGVPTSTAAILGEAERGPTEPTLVTSYKEYQRWFGSVFANDKFLPYAVSGFFENGGKRAFIARIAGRDAASATAAFGDTFSIRAVGAGSWGKRVFVRIDNSTTEEPDGNGGSRPVGFRIRLAYWPTLPDPLFDPFAETRRMPRPTYTEDFDDLSPKESSPDFYGKRFPLIDLEKGEKNQGPDSSALAVLVRAPGAALEAKPDNGNTMLQGGEDDETPVGVDDYIGRHDNPDIPPQGLEALTLDGYRDVALVYAPGVETDVIQQIIIHCENMRFRFAVIDSPKGQRNATDLDPRTTLPTDSSYAAFYYPWIVISDPRTGARKLVPPGGHTLGVYARTDTERGVFKAPANETLRGALDLEYQINDETQDSLNPRSVNVIRNFPGRGIRVWGARTLTSNALWRYNSVRRLFIFLERSIYEGTQWVVFEPNDPRLWARVSDTIRLFLRTQWRLGALSGRTEEQAFFITCDETVMTQDDLLNGRLICEIGIAPVRPAEFVIFRIFQNTAEAQR
ncbi:phage tail sheath family protein [Rhizobium sp. WYJ-E13]|uniref:phage tail sheath family protein n=1 Tax=Rhizobium sp. WYJ-E13 TaxID=2849093 RepID=UPI001C1F084A|nr:phage tail sheath family protein [Rhizobium sp. WYJ-E13]QWW71219.1 phage tail sheath family protein [Rhizobium sp. WYJ-E13]